jgi:hypothetical protein
MNWNCEQVLTWCKSFISDDAILKRIEGQLALFALVHAVPLVSIICICLSHLKQDFIAINAFINHPRMLHTQKKSFVIKVDFLRSSLYESVARARCVCLCLQSESLSGLCIRTVIHHQRSHRFQYSLITVLTGIHLLRSKSLEMSSFTCPFCANERAFDDFPDLFRHITTFHQHDSQFRLVCNLKQTCGTLYRTFSAYKSHVYRRHQFELQSTSQKSIDGQLEMDLQRAQNTDEATGLISLDSCSDDGSEVSDNQSIDMNDVNDSDYDQAFETIKEESEMTMANLKKSFVVFIMQLREEFHLPKNTMNTITSYIVTLIESLLVLIRRDAPTIHHYDASLPPATSRLGPDVMISVRSIEDIVDHLCQHFRSITKSEYRFLQVCHHVFNHDPPVAIISTDPNSNIESEVGYFIPIERTLCQMLRNERFLSLVIDNINKERRSNMLDEDLMFSFRHGQFGSRIDDDSLLIQLYLVTLA